MRFWSRLFKRDPDGEHARQVVQEAEDQLAAVRKRVSAVKRVVQDASGQIQQADQFARAIEESMRPRRTPG